MLKLKHSKKRCRPARITAGLLAAVLLLMPLSPVFAVTADEEKNAINGLNTATTQTATGPKDVDTNIRLNGHTNRELNQNPAVMEQIKAAQELKITQKVEFIPDTTAMSAKQFQTAEQMKLTDLPNDSAAETILLPGLGSTNNLNKLYPGNILATTDGDALRIITGAYANTNLQRYVVDSAAKINFETSFSRTFNVADLTPGEGAVSRFRTELYKSEYDSDKGKLIQLPTGEVMNTELTVVPVSSPDQTAALAGVGTGALDQLISKEKWAKIDSGELTAAVVSYVQIIGYIDCVRDRAENRLYADSVTAQNIKDAFKGGGMMIERVYYGRQMLALADLTVPGQSGESLPDLAAAVKAYLEGNDSGDEGDQNAVKYASVSKAFEMGWNEDETWQSIIEGEGSLDDLKTFLADDYTVEYNNNLFEQHLVPVRYLASALNSQFFTESPNMMGRKVDGPFYRTQLTRCVGIKNMTASYAYVFFSERATLKVIPLDLDTFKANGTLNAGSEETVDLEHGKTFTLPAYKMYGTYTLALGDNDYGIRGSGHHGAGIVVQNNKGDQVTAAHHDLSYCSLINYPTNNNWKIITNSREPLYKDADVLSQEGTGDPREGKTITWTEDITAAANGRNLAAYNTAQKTGKLVTPMHRTIKRKIASNEIASTTASWQKDSNGDLSIRIDIPLKHFQDKVTVDGELLDPSNYDKAEGSTIIALHDDYLKTLAPGEHQLKVFFEVGGEEIIVPCTFNITESGNPFTGILADTTLPAVLAMMITAMALAAVRCVKRHS